MAPPLSPELRAYGDGDRAALSQHIPSAFYMTGEDALRVTGIAAIGGLSVTVSGRFLTLNGRIVPFVNPLVVPSTRVATSLVTQLGEGWLLNCVVVATVAAPIIGQAWVQVQVVRGAGAAAILLAELASGYVTAQQTVAYPPGIQKGTLEGPGYVRSITGTDPAAGVEISETVPTGARWKILAFKATLATDATVANRTAAWRIDDGTLAYFSIPDPAAQTASTSVERTLAGFGFSANVSGVFAIPIPAESLILRGAHRIRSVTANLQAGDNWTAPQMLVEEWLEGA